MRVKHQHLPASVYWVFAAAVVANITVTFIMLKYFM